MEHTGTPVRVAYLGGLGRSGSTLVSRTLDRVPGLVSVGELSNLWHQSVQRDTACGCGAPFSQCPFWQQVGAVAFGGWDQVDAREISALRLRVEKVRYFPLLLRPGLRPAFARDVERYRDITTRLFEAVLQVSGSQVVVDNSKLPSRALLLRSAPDVDLRVVHLVRSSYGTSYSWSKRQKRADDDSDMLRLSVGRSALRWTFFNSAFELLRRQGTPTLTLRYEDFVDRPRESLEDVLTFLDVPFAEPDLDFVQGTSVTLAEDHNVWGNPARMQVGPQQLRLDEQWREKLTARERRTIALLTAPGLRRYGYR
jgi:hypothetical protein